MYELVFDDDDDDDDDDHGGALVASIYGPTSHCMYVCVCALRSAAFFWRF